MSKKDIPIYEPTPVDKQFILRKLRDAKTKGMDYVVSNHLLSLCPDSMKTNLPFILDALKEDGSLNVTMELLTTYELAKKN